MSTSWLSMLPLIVAGAEAPSEAPSETPGEDGGTCTSNDHQCNLSPTAHWKNDEPSSADLELIKYKDTDGKMKELRLLQRVQNKWKEIGIQLDIGHAALEGIRKKHRDNVYEQCQEVFQIWREQGSQKYPYLWNGILSMLKDIQMKRVSEELEKALDYKT